MDKPKQDAESNTTPFSLGEKAKGGEAAVEVETTPFSLNDAKADEKAKEAE